MRALSSSLLALLLLAPSVLRAAARADGAEAALARINAPLAPLSAPLAAPAPLVAPALAAPAALPSAPATLSAPAALPAPAAALSPATAPAAADSGETTGPDFSRRIRRFLNRLADPFGRAPPAEAAPSEPWAAAARDEIARLRAEKKSKEEVRGYVRAQADEAVARIKAERGVANLGFHYNLHGGTPESYAEHGIRASRGDIARRDLNEKVYFFQSARHPLFDVLDASDPKQLFFASRMGWTLVVFDLDAPELKAARADGRITNFGAISMDFHGMSGVPPSAFLAPPLRVFTDVDRQIGLGRLTRDEETLATVRYLEAALRRRN